MERIKNDKGFIYVYIYIYWNCWKFIEYIEKYIENK